MRKLTDDKEFDWDDLGQLVRKDHWIDPKRITSVCVDNFGFLSAMSEEERNLAADPYGRQHALWEKLRTELPSG